MVIKLVGGKQFETAMVSIELDMVMGLKGEAAGSDDDLFKDFLAGLRQGELVKLAF